MSGRPHAAGTEWVYGGDTRGGETGARGTSLVGISTARHTNNNINEKYLQRERK
jgi:hypothetical protein